MKCVILCAGYATRLYPLTLDTPKPLLKVKGKPMINYILEKVEAIDAIDEIFIVTNDKFYENFLEWKRGQNFSKPVKIINDMTMSNEDRLGALGDLGFVLEKEKLNDDVLVIAGDNLFEFGLGNFVDFFGAKNMNTIGLYDLKDLERSKNFGIIEIGDGNEIISFEEKPESPKSSLISTAIYAYSREELEKIREYFKTSGPKEGPGYLIPYFLSSQKVYGFVFDGEWHDIGSKEEFERVNR